MRVEKYQKYVVRNILTAIVRRGPQTENENALHHKVYIIRFEYVCECLYMNVYASCDFIV